MDEIIKITVKTNASKDQVISFDEAKQHYKVQVKADHKNNKANLEVIKLFSKKFGKSVLIVRGLKSKNKVLKLI